MVWQLTAPRRLRCWFLLSVFLANAEPSCDDSKSQDEAVSLMQHQTRIRHAARQGTSLDSSGIIQGTLNDLENELGPDSVLKEVPVVEAEVEADAKQFWSLLWTDRPTVPAHPFPWLNWEEVKMKPLLICSIVLFFGAVLCSAGGIGGGGIYVTVLMVAGELSPYDAVPLSKAVVFFGALVSLVLNMIKAQRMQESGKRETLIDYNVCRLVVPCSLLGTLIGVMVNSLVPSFMIVVMLFCILCAMTYMSFQKFIKKYTEEFQEFQAPGEGEANLSQTNVIDSNESKVPDDSLKTDDQSIRNVLQSGEAAGAFGLLVLVIACGVLYRHADNCKHDISQGGGTDSCLRPVITTFMGDALTRWMSQSVHPHLSHLLPLFAIALPACICFAVAVLYSHVLMKKEGWTLASAAGYSSMALFTGCFAGLVGIGGGLVFSPFMLWMGLHSSVAVATSSTCVIFTSSSTTMQYLLTDRIILSLAMIYGVVSSVAAFIGTSAVHRLQDKCRSPESCITGVVALGVLASVALSVWKLCAIGLPHVH